MRTRRIENHISKLLLHFPAVAILGPRQSGKTTIAKQLQKSITKPCIYIDLELPSDRQLLDHAELFLESQNDKCVIIDEIQRLPELFPLLRALIDKDRIPARFILLGSASPEILQKSSETLAGRIIYTELTPFTISEIGFENQNKHFLRGGFPEPFSMNDDEIRMYWYQSFISTFIERDLPFIGKRNYSVDIGRVLSMLANTSGNLLNKSQISNSLGVNNQIVSQILYTLEHGYIIRLLKPFYANLNKRLSKSPKLYVRDTGLLQAAIGIRNQEQLYRSQLVGNIWESYIIEQITSIFKDKYEPWFYRTQDGTECDLVLTNNGIPEIGIEIKMGNSPSITKSFKTAIKDLNLKRNYIIIPKCNVAIPTKDGIIICNLEQFFQIEEY